MIRRIFRITGIVQGVGFRPFVYNLARAKGLRGYVLNDSSGVTIEVEGERPQIAEFSRELKTTHPPRARIFTFAYDDLAPVGHKAFSISLSSGSDAKTAPVSPDIAICDDCKREMTSVRNRRHGYPFINCTNCGPRFTIVKDVPYDRPNTTMSAFEMCPDCRREYEDPSDRRFHAQPNACAKCGPSLTLKDNTGKVIKTSNPVLDAARLLKEGGIFAIKGLGGYHLACDALNEKAVALLRKRKSREEKPFAVMVCGIKDALALCRVSTVEREILQGPEKPILIMSKKNGVRVLAESVAPRQKNLGIMLPYTPLHELLMSTFGGPLVMTSGNMIDEPIAYKDDDAFARLRTIADFFLVHDREIFIRCDDSVARTMNNALYIMRRSRGYAPSPLSAGKDFSSEILACGAELKNTFCMTRGRNAFVSQYIGDLDNPSTYEAFQDGIEHFKRLYGLKPTVVAHDLHPEYFSTKYAKKLEGVKLVGVQHHFAHIAACMAENGLVGSETVGLAMDGTGFGEDGAIWGSEIVLVRGGKFKRVGNLKYVPLLTGEKAVKEPFRMALSHLFSAFGDKFRERLSPAMKNTKPSDIDNLYAAWKERINSPMTSSMGRLFDAVSAIVGIRAKINYEAQAAIELEMASDESCTYSYPYSLSEETGSIIMDPAPLIAGVSLDAIRREKVATIGAKFHNAVAAMLAEAAEIAMYRAKVRNLVLSGGVFQNTFLLGKVMRRLDERGISYFVHKHLPPNDACVSFGQAVFAEFYT